MFLWRRLAAPQWWIDNEKALRARAGEQLVIIERPGGKRLQLEVTSESRAPLRNLSAQFGGHIEKLRHDWLKRFLGQPEAKRLKVGDRSLIIPAGPAFGTGDHPTTAMSLQLLRQLTRNWEPDWSFVDLGTGSGILALAAKCLGAKRVVGIDSDRMAISTAQGNARRNKIDRARFLLADVRSWRLPVNTDVVAANLNYELLIAILPTLNGSRWSILSGVLREQETELVHALKRYPIDVVQVRRRGKWIAILATVG